MGLPSGEPRRPDKGAPIRFCETNPPFFGLIFDAMDFARGIYGEILPNKSVGSFSKTNPPVRGFGGVWGDLLTRLGSDLGVFCGDGRGHDVHHSGQRSGHNGAPKRIRGRRGPPRQTAQFGLPGDGIWGISSSLPGVPVVPGRIEISDE